MYPSTLSPRSSTAGSPGRPGSGSGFLAPRTRIKRREPSGVFTLFQTAQIQQFKEAFSLIDQDGDGIVSESDLKGVFSSLGMTPSARTMQQLLDAKPGGSEFSSSILDSPSKLKTRGVNFTMFLTMMGEHLLELDPEADMLEAFACFDENDEGKVKVEEMRKWLSEVGDRMDSQEIERLFKGPYTDRQGNFNYREWAKALRINQDDDNEEPPN